MREKKSPGADGAAPEARTENQQSRADHIETPAGVQGHPIYVIRVRSRGDDDIRHLRGLLKVLLRRFGFRCISIEAEARR